MYALLADEQSYTRSEPEEGDGPWLHQGDYGIHVSPRSLHRRDSSRYDLGMHEAVTPSSVEYECEDIPVGSPAFVVVVVYTDGGTFGSNGYWTVASVRKTIEDAQRDEEAARGPQPKDRYRPWDGFFAHLDDVLIFPTVVLP